MAGKRYVDIETHLHVRPVSPCSKLEPADVVSVYSGLGYYAVFVTDHLYGRSLDAPGLEDWAWERKADYYLSGYRAVKKAARRTGLKVFLGMEVTTADARRDFLVFGVTEDFVYECGPMYRHDIKYISKKVHDAGLLLFAAHPYRYGMEPADPRYYDGMEIFNSHPRHASRNPLACGFAYEHGLWVSSGSDAHRYEDMGRSGVMMEPIDSETEFADYYREKGSPELIIVCDDEEI